MQNYEKQLGEKLVEEPPKPEWIIDEELSKKKTENEILLENDIDNEKENKLKDMMFNCLGVLYSLKQSGEVVLTENKFIKNLWTHITENNQEEFHQINDILLNLSIKNKI